MVEKNMEKMDIESSGDSASEASSCESDDNRNLEIIKHNNGKNSESEGGKPEDFKLSCLHNWNENMLSSCLKNYLKMEKQFDKDTTPHVASTPSSKSNFIPWWEEFTRLKNHKPGMISKTQAQTESDTYDSWFDKNSASGTNWLCASSSSAQTSSTLLSQTAEVEDVKVPSIYGNKPATKGRRALKRERRAERSKDLGKKWFGMKAPDVDEKLKNDMDLIRMRSVLDPKRFYKHQDRKGLPKYFQMGTVVDEGTDFYSSRLTKKQRKQTLVEELMADANIRQYNKKKYAELQHKMRGKKKLKGKQPKQ